MGTYVPNPSPATPETTTPTACDAGAGAAGSSTQFAGAGHKHTVTVGTPVALTAAGTNSQGTGTALALATHVHALPAGVAPTRAVNSGTGLTGGGDLSADRTLAVTYGTTSTSACVGNDSRLSDDRTSSGIRTASGIVAVSFATAPSAAQVLTATSGTAASWISLPAGVAPTRQVLAGTGLTGGGDLSADRTLAVSWGTTSTTSARGDDARLSDDRTASGIRTASGVVAVSTATAPTANQVLTAASATAASWVTPTACIPVTGPGTSFGSLAAWTGTQGNGLYDSGLQSNTVVTKGLTATGSISGSFTAGFTVTRLDTPTVPITLSTINDGQFLKRSGPYVVSAAALPTIASSADTNLATWSGTGGNALSDSGVSLATVARTTDAAMTNARTPVTHVSTHANGGSDELDVTGLAGVLWEPQQTALIAPIVTPVTLQGTAETAIASCKITIPANRMTLGHSVKYALVLNQTGTYSATTPTLTLRIRYGTAGTTADALVAALVFAAGTSLATAPQFVEIYHTVRGPLAASCAATTSAIVFKGTASGIGGGALIATAAPTMTAFTCTPGVQTYWTLTYSHGNASNAYIVNHSNVELIEW